MTGRTRALALMIVVGLIGPVIAQVPAAWQHWRYVAPVEVEAATAPRLVAVSLPAAVTIHAREGWADLRIIGADGQEVPYVLHAHGGRPATDWRPARILEPSTVAGQFTQVVLDSGEAARLHNAVRLSISRDRDFLAWVEVAVSDDGRTWRVVRERGPIFDLSTEGLGEATVVPYPDSTSRYLRVRVLDGSRVYRLVSAEVGDDVQQAAELTAAGIELIPAPVVEHRSVWLSPPDAPRMPIAAIRFETTQDSFARPVTVEASDDEAQWRRVASGEVIRLREAGGAVRENLSVTIPETAARRWRVTVYNADDAPLAAVRGAMFTVPRRVVFQQQPGGVYRLIYGNSRATAPAYDLARVIDRAAIDAAAPATAGAESENAGYADPAPWTERHSGVLWAALIAAVVVLGAVTIRAMRAG